MRSVSQTIAVLMSYFGNFFRIQGKATKFENEEINLNYKDLKVKENKDVPPLS